ncbi:hypothetical protein MFIFM68171_03160 [Madurella fahalii]|uniref:Stc1 domain-containing protein n=1 Tax=Madurella fahalii TaxID=1157608 RepID=A0ABQ0G5A4_9PEZI
MVADRVWCTAHCKWMPRGKFSRNQLQKYEKRLKEKLVSPNNSGIQCIEHSKPNTPELQCQGPCNRVRELRYFSKNTRRSGKEWCIDCTSWQVMQEVGEALPPPGAQLSPEEIDFRSWRPGHSSDETAFDGESKRFHITESVSVTEDGSSGLISTQPLSDLQKDDFCTLGNSQEDSIDNDPILTNVIPPHLRGFPNKAPHWFLPDMDGPLTSTSGTLTTQTDDAHAADTWITPQGLWPVSFDVWGPNGEHTRMVKAPTVTSSSAHPTTATTRAQKPKNLGRKGWAKPSQRKRPPQLPDYLKYDIPIVAGDDNDGLNPELDDGITWNV